MSSLEIGYSLPETVRTITASQLQRYADVSGDQNAIHLDAHFAATTPFGGIVAHGMLILAYLARSLEEAFGDAWTESGALSVRFRSPVKLGDTVTATGVVTAIAPDDHGTLVRCRLWCTTGGEPVITGEATVRLPGQVAAVDDHGRAHHVV